MNATIALLLAQDALVNGAIYALLALTMVMVYSVSRIILMPQGEIVSLSALTLATLNQGTVPPTLWLLCVLSVLAAAMDLLAYLHERDSRKLRSTLFYLCYPLGAVALSMLIVPMGLGPWFDILLTIVLIAPLGPLLYRVAFQAASRSSVLVLLFLAMAVHIILLSFGLIAFGPEGVRVPAQFPGVIMLWGLPLQFQGLFVLGLTIALIVLMALFFSHSLTGKALRATASNRTGARLVGIPTETMGKMVFLLASFVGAITGIIAAPLTTIYYDTGFLLGLKGFIAGIFAGLASYPVAAAGALLISGVESYASFWASAFKDVIVFALVLPILLWRNLASAGHDEEDEE
jgi:branched-chain amino acid transport system permease protein